ncbi:Bifunctional purine biosynthesis protein PurH [Marasmius crinis-equi]|uniref:Bifunctional purine biosynthesis protein PurH n=1 Tax=Marasmius crinis-equi TaxID=585013 RepID=A0ABR3FSW1_9AGAR
MDNFVFSVVTSVFTVGGLIGSAIANIFMDKYGRRGSARISAFCVALGSAIMGLSGGVTALSFGRFLVGIGSGIGICLGPVYLAEIAPKGIAGTVDSSSDPLLDESDPEAHPTEPTSHTPQTALTIPQILFHTPADVRKPLVIITCAMIGQQISGINAVLYYSTDILSQSLPELGKYVSLGITVVNVLMTFPPIFLAEKMGRKRLLMISTSSALVCLLMVGIGLNKNWVTISSIFIIGFVMSFAVGLGPIPFVMIPEVSPYHSVSGLSSIALTLNWFTNFIVGLFFLPLRNLLAGGDPSDGGDPSKQGRVFWVFAVALLTVMSVVGKMWKAN